MKLLGFNYTIEYKKGAENVVADALSRKDRTMLAITSFTPAWIADIEQSYYQDKTYTEILQQVTINDQAVPHYTVHSGVLRYKGRLCIGSSTDLRHKILQALHASPIGGHSGITATYQRVKRIFHWPQLKKAIETFVSECLVCQRAKSEQCHYPGLLSPLPIPNMAWTFINMDFVEGLPKSGNKNAILVVVDRLTKYAHFLPLAHPFTAQSVAQLFMDNIFKLHGLQVAIVIDRDKIFTSKLWQDMFKALKVSTL
jgi:hypothetical protein